MSDPCKAEACQIQGEYAIHWVWGRELATNHFSIACLKRFNYDESKCTKVIDQLYACCTQFYTNQGEDARSPCCPIPSLLELKIKQREQEKVDAKLLHQKRWPIYQLSLQIRVHRVNLQQRFRWDITMRELMVVTSYTAIYTKLYSWKGICRFRTA